MWFTSFPKLETSKHCIFTGNGTTTMRVKVPVISPFSVLFSEYFEFMGIINSAWLVVNKFFAIKHNKPKITRQPRNITIDTDLASRPIT